MISVEQGQTKPSGTQHIAAVCLMVVLACVLLSCKPAHAVPANPEGALVAQPDGSQVMVYLRGDERAHWHEDRNGYLVQKSPKTRHWVYAEESNGKITPTRHILGKENPARVGIKRPNISRIMGTGTSTLSTGTQSVQTQAVTTTGVMKNLVVLVNFSDLTIPYTRQQYDDLFNQIGYTADGAVGSVKDYYHEVSYNNLTVESVVVDPVTLDFGYAYYGANSGSGGSDIRPREMVQQALAKLEARGFDFSTVDGNGDGWVDGLTIIHAGGGEEYSGNNPDYIWSHKWELGFWVRYDGTKMQEYHTEPARRGYDSSPSSQGITRIGVICHENAHFLGLPDLYDTDYSSSGVGRFCLMASGSWGGGDGRRPTHLSAWCKTALGWVTPTVISSPGSYSLNQVETNQQIYKLRGSFPVSQYFLVENRQGVGFDAALPGASRGLLIWHVDENQSDNTDETHYLVDLEEASGTQHLEQASHVSGDDADYFRSNSLPHFSSTTIPDNLSYSSASLGIPIVQISSSGSTMTFSIQGPDTIQPTGSLIINSGAAYATATTTLNHSATDAGGVTTMRCSNDGINYASWVTYSATQTWTLSGADGPKTVYAQYRDNAGNISIACSDGVILDATAPAASIPSDAGAYTGGTTVVFNWPASSDSGSGFASYNCKIGTTPGAENIFSGNVGSALTKSITGIKDQVYYCRIQAVDNAGNASPWSDSDGIAVVDSPGTSIAAAKSNSDNTSVGISSVLVTAIFGDGFYIRDIDGVSGIKVVASVMPVGITIGALVDVGGTMKTNAHGERYIDGTVIIH